MTLSKNTLQQKEWLCRRVWIAVLIGTVSLAWGCRKPVEQDPIATPDVEPDVEVVAYDDLDGRELYLRHCAACHGENGNGKGLAAAFLFPRPRDFGAGKFRLVSTTNSVPTAEDIDLVLVRGMPGSSMPPWAHLPIEQRRLIIDEVLRLHRVGTRERFVRMLREEEEYTEKEIIEEEGEIVAFVERRTTSGPILDIASIPPSDEAAILRGREVYVKQSCFSCHGDQGRGDGTKEMIDDEGLPTSPRDLTLGIFKGGEDPAAVYRRIIAGMPGTPMPSSNQLSHEEICDMVHYVRSLSTEQQRQVTVLNRESITVARAAALPGESTASGWDAVPPTSLRMVPLWWRNDSDPGLSVQALHDGESIAIRLTWNDSTADLHAAQTEAFEDGVALELFRGRDEPFMGMGSVDDPVDVWFWDADRQGTPLAVEDIYPDTVVDNYPFSEALSETADYDRPGTAADQQPDISLPARATGNPIVPTDDASGGSSLEVAGPGTVTFRPSVSRIVTAHGEWSEGRWEVVFTRPLSVAGPTDGVVLEPGSSASVAFAIWDGSHRDRDGQKMITIWQELMLEE